MDRLDANARVGVFIDGQNVYKTCRGRYGHGYCHPLLLARQLLQGRRLQFVRYYSGIHDPRINPDIHAAVERRHDLIRKSGVHVEERPLRYRLEWGLDPIDKANLPEPKLGAPARSVHVAPYQRPREKGIDLKIGIDVIDFALRGDIDVAIIVSSDNDLTEVAKALRQTMVRALKKHIWIEAAVFNEKPAPIQLVPYNYTHQLTRRDFDQARDSFDYTKTLDPVMKQAWLQACTSTTT